MIRLPKNIKIHPRFKNRYWVAIYVFAFWLMVFDNMSVWDLMSYKQEVRQLEKEKRRYEEQIQSAKQNLKELTTDMDNLEKFAREQYFMKRDNEDIFVITEQAE